MSAVLNVFEVFFDHRILVLFSTACTWQPRIRWEQLLESRPL